MPNTPDRSADAGRKGGHVNPSLGNRIASVGPIHRSPNRSRVNLDVGDRHNHPLNRPNALLTLSLGSSNA